MNNRIKHIRKDQGLTLEKFGERLGVTKTAISNIEAGKRNVTEQMLRSICREFHVNEAWLRTGFGEPYSNTLQDTIQKLADEYDLREIEVIALTEYLKLDDAHRQAFRDYLFNVVAAQKKASPPTDAWARKRLISYYYRLASAGTGQLLIDNLPEEHVEIPDDPKYKDVSYAISVNGSSMEPLYHDGDVLLVEATRELRIGDIGIFQLDDQCYVKKLGETSLISLNEEYTDIPLNESARAMGRVIDKLTPADV